jgi:PEP-CTERM motif
MRLFPTTAAAALALALGTAAQAAPLIADGVSYTLESQATANPLTQRFALVISGENTASDTEGGRTGINGIAFNEVSNGATASGVMIAPPTGFTFVSGGLQSTGCVANPNPNFFCFDNTAIPPTPSTLLSGTLVFVFDVTLKSGFSWAGYHPDFKIDWVGTQNNYDLVSKAIDVSLTCPDCNPRSVDPVPEPMTLALFGSGLFGLGVVARRRKH